MFKALVWKLLASLLYYWARMVYKIQCPETKFQTIISLSQFEKSSCPEIYRETVGSYKFLLIRIVGLVWVWSLHITGRNHPNMFLLIMSILVILVVSGEFICGISLSCDHSHKNGKIFMSCSYNYAATCSEKE